VVSVVYVANQVKCTHALFVVALSVENVTIFKRQFVNLVKGSKLEIAINHSNDHNSTIYINPNINSKNLYFQVIPMENTKNQLIKLLKDNHVVKYGNFTLSSGKESNYYVDMKRAITDPIILTKVAEIISKKLDTNDVDKIAGPALGAIPIVTAVSILSSIPMLMIRKEKKDYGTSELIEGDLQVGDKVIVLEDVTTTGGSLIKAVKAVSENGGLVNKAFVIVDRDEGAIDNLKKEGIELEPLVSVNDFL
jgi:orotate phosphoribosyltransferase